MRLVGDDFVPIMQDLSKIIKSLAKQHSIKQKDIAEYTGIHQSTISSILNCRFPPSFRQLLKIMEAVGAEFKIVHKEYQG
jgi:transcriptional regulator with XRE-family HTH domain